MNKKDERLYRRVFLGLSMLSLVLLFTFALTGCQSESSSTVDIVSPGEVIEMMEAEKTFAFAIGANTCPPCVEYGKELVKYIDKTGDTIYYIEVEDKDIDMEEFASLLIDYLDVDQTEAFITPATYVIRKGKVLQHVPGAITADDIETLMLLIN